MTIKSVEIVWRLWSVFLQIWLHNAVISSKRLIWVVMCGFHTGEACSSFDRTSMFFYIGFAWSAALSDHI